MIKAIERSIPAYISGLRCWGAFNDALGISIHFPASEKLVMQYTAVFGNAQTLQQYLKHLRWAHRFLRLANNWDTPALQQVVRGVRKAASPPLPKVALTSRQVKKMVKAATKEGMSDVAALMAIARLFLLRVPSEALPLEWDGDHSRISLRDSDATIVLMRRKNVTTPTSMTRACCCESSGRGLCAVHWLHDLHRRSPSGRLFQFNVAQFRRYTQAFATMVGVSMPGRVGTHAFRRGMAQDIVDAGGSLAILLRAGEWRSAAFLRYLRESQPQEAAVAQAVINLSDSEGE